MRKIPMLVTFAALLIALPAFAQPAPKDLSLKTDETWAAMKSFTVEKRKEAQATGRNMVRAVDQDIKDIERSTARASDEMKAELRKDVKALKAKRKEASRMLNDMGKATEAGWDSAKQGFVNVYSDLHKAVEKTAAKLK